MSFIEQPAPVARPNRCQLFGPGSRPEIFEKMAGSAADVVNLDLEDSVSPADKPKAREAIIEAVGQIDWGQKSLSVRINGLDTEFWYKDVVDLLERADERLDLIMIPKAGTAADIYAVDMLVTQAEAATGRKKRIGFEMIIETALGMYKAKSGAWPTDVSRTQAVSELEPYFDSGVNPFAKECPIGGVYDYEGPPGWNPPQISIRKNGAQVWSDADALLVDQHFDDGDLSTGAFRQADANRLFYVLD